MHHPIRSGSWLRGLGLCLSLAGGCSGAPPASEIPQETVPSRDYIKEWYGDTSADCLPAGCSVTPVEVATGFQHSCARMQDGSVRCWGLDDTSQLGGSSIARPVPGVEGAVRIAAGIGYSCAILRGGSVKCWGQVPLDGMKEETMPLPPVVPTPSIVTALASQPAGQLVARGSVACAILATDEARATCWGVNNRLSTPLRVPSNVSPSLINVRILSLTMSYYNYGLVRFDGTANRCDPEQYACLVPLGGRKDIVQLAMGNTYGLALVRGGTVHPFGGSRFIPCSGENPRDGQQAAPVPYCKSGMASDWVNPEPWPGLDQIVDLQVSQPLRKTTANGPEADLSFACALRGEGEVLCWGMNNYGQRGTGEVTEQGYPYPAATAELTKVPGLHEVTQLALGGAHACALTNKKEVYCWGQNGPEMRLGDSRKSGAPPSAPVHFVP